MNRYKIAAEAAEQRFERHIKLRTYQDVVYLNVLSQGAGHVLSLLHKLECEALGRPNIRLIAVDGILIEENTK